MKMLSFEQAPPISVPMRFFLTAPLFGILAGALLLWQGPAVLESRWAPATLALTHLITAGFMLQVMCGALLQFIPVAAGGNIWRPRLVAAVVHLSISLAVLLFAGAFLATDLRWLDPAAGLFALALVSFGLAAGHAVLHMESSNSTITALRCALGGLIITLLLGATLVQAVQGRLDIPLVQLTNLHAAWGLAGWVLILVCGVSYFLIPMFQLTPSYPTPVQRFLPAVLLAILALWSLQLFVDDKEFWEDIALAILLATASAYAGSTLWLQGRRKRKAMDPALQFFRMAMLCILAAALSWLVLHCYPGWAGHPAGNLWLGSLLLFGAATSAICGMLYKIAPFALWMHLQRIDASFAIRLNTRMLLPEPPVRRHFQLHCTALAVLLAAVLFPALAHLAGALAICSFAWLHWSLVKLFRQGFEFEGRTAHHQS